MAEVVRVHPLLYPAPPRLSPKDQADSRIVERAVDIPVDGPPVPLRVAKLVESRDPQRGVRGLPERVDVEPDSYERG